MEDTFHKLDWVLTIALVVLCAVIFLGNWIHKIVTRNSSRDQEPPT